MPAYEQGERRLEAARSHITTLVALGALLMVAAASLAGALIEGIDFDHALFVLAVVIYGVAAAGGLAARHLGTLASFSPLALEARALTLRRRDYRSEVVRQAAADWRINEQLIERTRLAATVVGALLLVEVGLLALWIAVEG